MNGLIKILILCFLTFSVAGKAYAGPKSVGATFCYGNIGLAYEHEIDSDSFAEIQLRAETICMFDGKSDIPGISGSFTWNLRLAEYKSRNGNVIDFFAGPGLIGGFSQDRNRPENIFLGFKGKIGGECTFCRNIALSISVSPVIGVHFGREDEMLNMHLYRNGLLYSLMPEIGIRYSF